MASVSNALTRIGLGGPSINYTRPLPGNAAAPDTGNDGNSPAQVQFTLTVGQLLNNSGPG